MEETKEYEKNLKEGEILFKEGDVGDEMYLIKSGKIKISKGGGDIEKTLAFLKEGDFFGEMAIIDGSPRSASATAVEETKLVITEKTSFTAQVKKNPLIEYLIETLIKRLRTTDEQIKFLLIKNEERRVVAMLLTKIKDDSIQSDKGIQIKTPFSYSFFGNLVGIKEKEARDIFDSLVNSKLIRIEVDKLYVKSEENLEEYLRYISLKEKFGR